MMQKHKKDGVEWLEFDLLAEIPGLAHGSFLRHGGSSQGDFAALNFGHEIGDLSSNVEANRRLALNSCLKQHNIPDTPVKIVHGKQCHGVNTVALEKDTNGFAGDCDALITNHSYLALLIKHADCQAAIFYDPVNRAIANVHCGWRGSVQNIYAKTIQSMQSTYGTNPTDLIVGISPSLGPNFAEFIHYKTELPESFWSFQIKPNYFDFWAISEMQLKACGVQATHIEVARVCTYECATDCFSYRRDKPTGRHGTYAILF